VKTKKLLKCFVLNCRLAKVQKFATLFAVLLIASCIITTAANTRKKTPPTQINVEYRGGKFRNRKNSQHVKYFFIKDKVYGSTFRRLSVYVVLRYLTITKKECSTLCCYRVYQTVFLRCSCCFSCINK
jgi:hypothetical protein